jgi:hypothetical protein
MNRRVPDGGVPSKNGALPWPVKGLLISLISMFGVLGIRLIPATFAEGWRQAITLVVALGLIVIVLIELVRTQKR